MFAGFANVTLPKDANMIAEPAQVVVMVPGTRAATAEGALANLKNIIISVFLLCILAIIIFIYFKMKGSSAKYEGRILPGIRTEIQEKPVKTVHPKPEEIKFDIPQSVPVFQKSDDIIKIQGDIPTWTEDEMSDEIDKKVTETDESIIAKLKNREQFLKDLGENVASQR